MVLKIDYEVFRLVRADSEKFWFDPYSYIIIDKDSDEAEFIEDPIPFPFIEKTKQKEHLQRLLEKSLHSSLNVSQMKRIL